jgi:hypothetical protein
MGIVFDTREDEGGQCVDTRDFSLVCWVSFSIPARTKKCGIDVKAWGGVKGSLIRKRSSPGRTTSLNAIIVANYSNTIGTIWLLYPPHSHISIAI